jgi:hypothetical protein
LFAAWIAQILFWQPSRDQGASNSPGKDLSVVGMDRSMSCSINGAAVDDFGANRE